MNPERQKALRKLKTARGQLDGIIKMIDEDRYCIDISNQICASIALLKRANEDILKGHMRTCIKEAMQDEQKLDEKLDELFVSFAKIGK